MAVRIAFADELGQRATHIFFVPAVVLASALSGLRAGIVASILGAAAALWCDWLIGPVAAGNLIGAAAFRRDRPCRGARRRVVPARPG
jgi:two-component system sensor kinase FixL